MTENKTIFKVTPFFTSVFKDEGPATGGPGVTHGKVKTHVMHDLNNTVLATIKR